MDIKYKLLDYDMEKVYFNLHLIDRCRTTILENKNTLSDFIHFYVNRPPCTHTTLQRIFIVIQTLSMVFDQLHIEQ